MLLLLTLLYQSDSSGFLTLEQAADCFIKFYKLRTEAGLTPEKSYNSRRAIAEIPDVSRSKMRQMLKTSPFPRFERQGLLDISEDNQYFILNPALLAALTPVSKLALRAIAIQRIAEHFEEETLEVEEMVKKGIASSHRGDVFQIVLSRRFEQKFQGDEFNVYRALRNINPSPYLFYFDYGDYKLMGSSPESQLIVRNRRRAWSLHLRGRTYKLSLLDSSACCKWESAK